LLLKSNKNRSKSKTDVDNLIGLVKEPLEASGQQKRKNSCKPVETVEVEQLRVQEAAESHDLFSSSIADNAGSNVANRGEDRP